MKEKLCFSSEEELLSCFPKRDKSKWRPGTKDIEGLTFSELTPLYTVERPNKKGVFWACKCSCGNFVVVKSINLNDGNSKSCGCIGRKKAKETIKIATRAALKVTTEKLLQGDLVGPNGVRYFGPSEEKDNRNFRKDYFICPLCGNKFLSIRANIKNGHTSSCGCSHSANGSIGEKAITRILLKNSISFEREKSFKEIPRIARCRYDFYLPKLNILLEYDGQQHFQYIKHFDNKITNFKHRQELDRLKNAGALAMGIKLYRIPYWDLDTLNDFNDLVRPQYLVTSKFHNDEVYRQQKLKEKH